LTSEEIKALRVFERRKIRKIRGPIKDGETLKKLIRR
jgi:hypothetical protein